MQSRRCIGAGWLATVGRAISVCGWGPGAHSTSLDSSLWEQVNECVSGHDQHAMQLIILLECAIKAIALVCLQVLEQRTSFGSALSAPLLCLLLALLLSAGGVLPTDSSSYDMIWTYVMPLGAALYLLESDLRQ